MNRRFITLLIVTMLVPILLFAGEKPQTIMEKTLKNSSGKKGEIDIDTYSLIKNFYGYKATRSTSTFNPSKATLKYSGRLSFETFSKIKSLIKSSSCSPGSKK